MRSIDKIMVIERDFPLALYMKIRIHALGLKVDKIYSDYDQAKREFKLNRPDLIIVDVEKNDENLATETVKKMQEIDDSIKVIFIIDAHHNDNLSENLSEIQPYMVLTKPIGNRQFAYSILSALSEKNSGSVVETQKTTNKQKNIK